MVEPGRLMSAVARQRDRSIATILAYKEREVDQYVPAEVQRNLRKVILDEMNDLTNLSLDLLAGNVIFNEVIDLLNEIKDQVNA